MQKYNFMFIFTQQQEEVQTSQEQEAMKMIPLGQRATTGQVTACL